MLDFGEELTLESFKIPWLIWIQLFVLLLLLALLYCFSIIALDQDLSPSTHSHSHLHIQQPSNHHSTVTNPLHNTRGVENLSIKGEIVSTGNTGIVREEIAVAEGEASTSSLYFLHPCYYFNLAREAFLKCLGLDSASESDAPSLLELKKRQQN
ncbi:uncharacterized protein LOC109799630 [Cajanus cajan]|nr:uncharacterized protein LOC109799630 [Cajanus cajan]